MKKIGMIGIISNPVTSLSSHNGGWTIACKLILNDLFKSQIDILTENDDWNQYDVLIINEGVNYKKGVYNFFGGVQDKTKIKLNKLLEYKNILYCINDEINYNEMCLKRKELNDFIKYDFRIPEIIKTDKISNNLILGDSHSISVIRKNYSISRNDGKTLYGFLKDPYSYFDRYNTDKLITYFGNIDIRFHLASKHDLGKQATIELANNYIKFCKEINATPVCLLPIEDESRKIPGTGLYKNMPYCGSRIIRRKLVEIFNNILKNEINCLKWPEEWYDIDYDFMKEMEARQSVHLRPSSYMFSDQLININQLELF